MDGSSMSLESKVMEDEKEAIKTGAVKKQKQDISCFPFIEYKGKVIYHTTLIDCALSCENILQKVKDCDELFPIGFDMEWPFSYQTGSGKTAVIQLSPSFEECYVLHVSQIKNLPKSLTELLKHPKVRLAGVNIRNDVRKLARDFSGVDVVATINNCVDASDQANIVLNRMTRWSMQKLIAEFFSLQISKDKKVRNSKWDVVPLSKNQQIYAATDAYASLKLYHHLTDLKKKLVTVNITLEQV